MKDLVIPVDPGGAQLQVAVLDSSYHIVAWHAEPTDEEDGADAARTLAIGRAEVQ